MNNKKKRWFEKLPVRVQAYQTDVEFDVQTLEGPLHASVGDWIITGIRGEDYPCKPDVFARTYREVDGPHLMPVAPEMTD